MRQSAYQAIHRLVCGIRKLEPGPGPGQAIFAGECPYRGLEVFEDKHSRFFFGRETQVGWLLQHRLGLLTHNNNARRFLAIVGPSASGKSSLVQAGILPALRVGRLEGSSNWPIVVFRPGYDPLESLALELTRLSGFASSAAAIQDLMAGLIRDPTTHHLTARVALREKPGGRRVVLADQFEEIYTLCTDETIRRSFVANLLHAATVVGGQTIVLLTMRADFLGKCALSPDLAVALSDGQELVGPLNQDELRMVIERPAAPVGCTLEAGLVDLLLQEVKGQSGVLHLLQYTLLELWRRRHGSRLSVAAYREIGGVGRAIEQRANKVIEEFRSRTAELEMCRRIFLRLSQPGEGTEDTKRRASLDELVASPLDRQATESVIRKLVDARLVTTSGRYVEIAHEALIRNWNQLRAWIDTDRAGLRTQVVS